MLMTSIFSSSHNEFMCFQSCLTDSHTRKLKAFADDKLNVTKIIISVSDRVETVVGKGEIACTSNFSFSHNIFKKLIS